MKTLIWFCWVFKINIFFLNKTRVSFFFYPLEKQQKNKKKKKIRRRSEKLRKVEKLYTQSNNLITTLQI